MKLIIGRPDETEVVLAEEVNGSWKPNPNIASEMATLVPTPSNSRCGSKSPSESPSERLTAAASGAATVPGAAVRVAGRIGRRLRPGPRRPFA